MRTVKGLLELGSDMMWEDGKYIDEHETQRHRTQQDVRKQLKMGRSRKVVEGLSQRRGCKKHEHGRGDSVRQRLELRGEERGKEYVDESGADRRTI